jgi:hypothetical protein
MRISKLLSPAVVTFAVWVGGGCGDAQGERGDVPGTRCGDGICSSTDCETQLRCPKDCGTCSGAECTTLDGSVDEGSCGNKCFTSCGCKQPGEVCSADFDGASEGTCIPIACAKCADTCIYEPDALDRCETGQCG